MYRREEDASKHYPAQKSKQDWLQSKKKFLLQNAIEGQAKEVKGVGRRSTQLLNNLRNRKGESVYKKTEMTVNCMNLRKKYKLPSKNPWTC